MNTILELNEEQSKLFEKIGLAIEEVEESVYWDRTYGLEDGTKKEIMKEGIRSWFSELYDYNLEYIWDYEKDIRLRVLSEYEQEICEMMDVGIDDFDPVDYLEPVSEYWPRVYINPKDVLYGETIPMRLGLYSDYDCQVSHFLESESGGYSYEESYFGDMVDALNLCPYTMFKKL